MTTHSMHRPKANIYRLYLPGSNGGRGLTQLELSYKISTIGLFWYLNLSDEWIKVSHSVVKEVREFVLKIDLVLETEFYEEMKNMENARKLRRIANEKIKKAVDTVWKSKLLHGQYPLWSQKADVDLHDSHQWLRSARLKVDTEGFIVAAQDQSHFTRHFQANILHDGTGPSCRFWVPRLLTTSSQGALFLPQMSI